MRLIFSGLVFLLTFHVVFAAEESRTDDQVPEFDPFAVQKLEKPFEYYPLDAELWRSVQEKLEKKKYSEVIDLGESHMAGSEEDAVKASEGKMIWGIGLEAAGFHYAAMYVFKQVAVEQSGSTVAAEALRRLDLIIRSYPYDFEGTYEFLTAKEFGDLHPEIQSFVSYHRAHHHLDLGLIEWFKEEKEQIAENSYWNYRWLYNLALRAISKNQVEPAKDLLKQVIDSPFSDELLKEKARTQVARLHFENGDFEKAYEVYSTLTHLGPREKGRILLEQAWTKYYLKDFSKALGVLEVLKAPYFDLSLNYERYLLSILIYRQLCHYEAVELIVEQFRRRFNAPFQVIRERGELKRGATLAAMALMDPSYQELANMVDGLRKERIRLEDAGYDDSVYTEILRYYKNKEDEIRNRIDKDLEEKVREVALELIDAEEQITFLEYTAKLDALRIVRQGENRSYAPPKISRWTFEKIYWRIDREFWWDELDHYQSMISSRCDLMYTPSSPGSNGGGEGFDRDEEIDIE